MTSLLDDVFVETDASSRAIDGYLRLTQGVPNDYKSQTENLFNLLIQDMKLQGYIVMRNSNRDDGLLNLNPLNNFICERYYNQMAWAGTKFYVKRSESMYREVDEWRKGNTKDLIYLDMGGGSNAATMYISPITDAEKLTNFMLFKFTSTQAVVAPNPEMRMVGYEEKSATARAIVHNVMLPGSVNWQKTYFGPIPTFQARVIVAPVIEASNLYTRPATKGWIYNSQLTFGWVEQDDLFFVNERPGWECYSKTSTTIGGYSEPQVEMNKKLDKLAGVEDSSSAKK